MSKCMKTSDDERRTTIMKKEADPFDFLSDDILLDILKRLPDAVLLYKAKYVCRRWFNLSTKNILLDHASFILQKSSGIRTPRLVGIREEQQELVVKVKDFNIPVEKIKSWCNEFLLIMHWSSSVESLYVFNLITNERLYLPDCHTHCRPHLTTRCGLALFFDVVKGVYKVIHFFLGPPFQCHILILGTEIDSDDVTSNWKKMEVAWDTEDLQYYVEAVSVQVQGRYFHLDIESSKYLVSVDMVKEETFRLSLPGSNDRVSSYYSIFEMCGFLALIDGVCRGKADIWILKDFQRMKWEKLQSMTFPDYDIINYPITFFLSPVCGTVSKRYIIFMKPKSRTCCSFDLKNGVLKELNIRIGLDDRYVSDSSLPNFMWFSNT